MTATIPIRRMTSIAFGGLRLRADPARRVRLFDARQAWIISTEIVCAAMNVPVAAVLTRKRGRGSRPAPESAARSASIYLAVTAFDVNRAALANAAGVQKQYIYRVLAATEDLRDKPDIDAKYDSWSEIAQRRAGL